MEDIEDRLCGLTFRLSPRSFYHVNQAHAEKLYRHTMRWPEFGKTYRIEENTK